MFLIFDVKYYIPSNPSRIVNIKIRDSNGEETILNGAINGDVKTISDPDGNGELTVKSLGIISSQQDCPGYTNTAVVQDGSGGYRIVNRNDYEDGFQLSLNPFDLFDLLTRLSNNVRDDTQFISAFDTAPNIDVSNLKITGDIEIGSGLFTVTADQDYFDSVLFIPPTQADPIIDTIDVNKMQFGTTSSARVVVRNNADTVGIVSLTSTSTNAGVTPMSTQFTLFDTTTQHFTITAGSSTGTGEICFRACSTGQFGGADCDQKCESFEITGDPVDEICGDGICQSNENNATCPEDCLGDDVIREDNCEDCFDWLFGNKLKEEDTCTEADVWDFKLGDTIGIDFGPKLFSIGQATFCPIFLVIIGAIILVTLIIILAVTGVTAKFLKKPKRRRKRR